MMDNRNPIFLPMTVTSRYGEALVKNDLRTWWACVTIAGLEANVIESVDPHNVLVPALRGIADDAYTRYLSLMPRAA
jgi:hypothetical protein